MFSDVLCRSALNQGGGALRVSWSFYSKALNVLRLQTL